MDREIARQLIINARNVLGAKFMEDKPAESVREALEPILEQDVLDLWLGLVKDGDWLCDSDGNDEDVVGMLSEKVRRENGMFMTPTTFAATMAGVIGSVSMGSDLLDLSAGCGALLVAAIRKNPEFQAVGVEQNPGLAVAAALALYGVRKEVGGGGKDRIYVGDGLSESGAWAEGGMRYEVVIGNPPYVGEKGNIALFAGLKEAHPHLESYFGARIDLLYLFFHRGLDLLAEGGRLVYLTSEYWLTARGAVRLREDLAKRSRAELFVTFGTTSIFRDAPGHHSLLSVFRRVSERAGEVAGAGDLRDSDVWALRVGKNGVSKLDVILDSFGARDVWEIGEEGELWVDVERIRVHEDVLGAQGWAPFVDAETVRWARDLRARGRLLGDLVRDQQGFVSGADRVTRAHLERFGWDKKGIKVGDPVFMFREDEIPVALAGLKGRLLLPVLRGRSLRMNEVFEEPLGGEYVLYVDGKLSREDEKLVVEYLAKFKAMLEVRREVKLGRMVWYRLHWPRRRADFEGPKLVVPRRAPGPCFSLDLSGSAVSSDCTYLVAPDGVEDAVGYLRGLMEVLNGEDVRRYLAAFGKRKGTQLEFYSDPLKNLPVRWDGNDFYQGCR